MQNLDEIYNIADAEASNMGLTVVDIKLSQQGKRRTLEITICRKGGRISLNDCEEFSRKLDPILDAHEPPLIDGAFMLEVQSPGLERQLKTEREFAIYAGEEVEVKMKDPKPSLGDFVSGKLHSLEKGIVKIDNPKPVVTKGNQPKKAKAKAAPEPEYPASIEVELSRVTTVRLKAPDVMLEESDDSEPAIELD